MLRLKPTQNIVMFQSADPINYYAMLRNTSKINRAFCIRHNILYNCVYGIMRGFHAWHACYNRILLLNNMLDLGFTGWYLHLDSDAYVNDINFDIAGYLAENQKHSFVFTPGAYKGPWDVNDGVFFANCAHPTTQEVAKRWLAKLENIKVERLQDAAKWYDTPGDQQLLHSVLREDPAFVEDIRHEHPRFINGPRSSFIRQILRAEEKDPQRRLDLIQMGVETAMEKQDLPSEEPVVLFCNLARALGMPIPQDLDTVRAAVADPDALRAFLEAALAKAELSA